MSRKIFGGRKARTHNLVLHSTVSSDSSVLLSSGCSISIAKEHLETVAILHGWESNLASHGYSRPNNTGPTARLTACRYCAQTNFFIILRRPGFEPRAEAL